MKRFQQVLQSHSGKVAELFSALLLYRCIGFASLAKSRLLPALFGPDASRAHGRAGHGVHLAEGAALLVLLCNGRHRQLRGHFFMRRSVTTLPEHAAF